MIGSKVRVARFRCEGTVVAERFGGHELSVKLDPPLGLLIWLRLPEVVLVAPPEAPPATSATPARADKPATPQGAAAARAPRAGLAAAQERLDQMEPAERTRWRARVGRNVIEALRFGIVPRYAVEALSVGLEPERRLFASDLARTRETGAVRVISAAYGTGKSHALDVMQMMALGENFLVARAELDAFECQANHPRNVYRALVKSLKIPGAGPQERGLAWLLDRAIASPVALDTFARRRRDAWHEFLGPALLNWQGLAGDAEGRDHLYQWIAGEDVELTDLRERAAVSTARQGLLSLGSYTTLSSHFTYLLGGLAALGRCLGYSGLVILLDEAEHLRLLSVEMETRAIDFFRGLVANALGRSLPQGYLEGSYQGGRKKIPFSWKLPVHLCLVVACTPTPGKDDLVLWVPDPRCVTTLSGRLSSADIESLIERVVATYRWASTEVLPPDRLARQKLASSLSGALTCGALKNLRQVVQTVIGGLDLVRAGSGWSFGRLADEVDAFARGRDAVPPGADSGR